MAHFHANSTQRYSYINVSIIDVFNLLFLFARNHRNFVPMIEARCLAYQAGLQGFVEKRPLLLWFRAVFLRVQGSFRYSSEVFLCVYLEMGFG